MFYTPLMYCAANGRSKCMKILLTNKSLIINQNQQMSGVNAFWIAAYFGHSECLKLLSKAGIFLFSKQLKTNCNPLHAAILRKHYSVADQIILLQKTYSDKSIFNETMKGNYTPLILLSKDSTQEANYVSKILLNLGVDVNIINHKGYSALSYSIINKNIPMITMLV